MITNPSFTVHQNVRLATEVDTDVKPQKEKGGLLGPRKAPSQQQNSEDALNPARRVSMYVKAIQNKREEVKNG